VIGCHSLVSNLAYGGNGKPSADYTDRADYFSHVYGHDVPI
jgi:hypothetical protein